ncbi:hypothetical protein PP722_23785 [Lysinibacillus sphaericus]|nr:hypothetical protein [Lysinibacillus sphaericus]
MKDIIKLDENNRCVRADCIYTKEDTTVEYEFENEEERMSFFDNLQDYVYQDGKFVLDEQPSTENKKAEQEAQLQKIMLANARATFFIELPDAQAATIPYCYPTWKSFVGKPLTKLNEQGKENRIEYGGELWKVRNDIPVVLENQAPGIETAALYERIDIEHAGTLEDPIPYDQTMTVYKGKYYIENEKIYKCIRDSEQPLYATCESLVGNYFELV